MLHEGGFAKLRPARPGRRRRQPVFVHSFRPGAPAQALHAASTRRNQDDLLAGCAQLGNLPRPVADSAEIKAVTVVGDEGGATDNKAAGVWRDGLAAYGQLVSEWSSSRQG